MKSGTLLVIALLLIAPVSAPAQTGGEVELPQIAEIALGEFSEIHNNPNVLTVELRSDAAIGTAMFPLAQSPEAIALDGIGIENLVVLIIDETSAAEEVAAAAARFSTAGCDVRRLSGNAAGWIAAGLAGPAAPRQSVRPGDVRFVIPRGLCEAGEPVQIFE